ncbi:hypothetical protein ACFQ1R_02035 [Mariniflexile jejuense]|uniref:Uncharacterized protein n=1 Tax=Mariniflexile jejuense TaxID=1173582 RepID=A0ABW3JH12_9FLAO
MISFSPAHNNLFIVNIPNQDQLYLDKSFFTISFWMKAASNLLPTNATSSYVFCKGSFTVNTSTGATGKHYNVEFKSSQF